MTTKTTTEGDRYVTYGVFVCHCGENIGSTWTVRKSRRVQAHAGVVHSEDYNYMCSDPGQSMIKQASSSKFVKVKK